MNKIIKTELVEWKKLKLFQPKELKTISKKQLDKLKTSLKNNGFKSPFYVWQENKENLWCLDGHTRIPVLKLLEEEGHNVPDELPANFINCKDRKEAKKAILIYNSKYADINKEEMFDFVSEFNFINLNFEIDIPSIDFNVKKEEKTDIPELEKAKIIKNGDLIQLNNHKVLCGDSNNKSDVNKIFKNEPDMVFTDPPYDLEKNDWLNYLNSDKIFLMGSDKQQIIFINNITNFRHFFIMPLKNPTLINNCRPMQGHSLISFFCNGKTEFKNLRDGFSTLLTKDMGKSHSTSEKENYHKLGKPILLPQSFIEHYSNEKDIIYDYFLGAGSTLLAAEKTGRVCYGIEIEPLYCEIIIKRFYNFCIDNFQKCTILVNNNKFNLKMLNSRKGD